jgi:trimeric autotransporter adhesin
MAPFSKSFSPPLSPDGMIVEEATPQSSSQLVSPLQDPFYYANIIQRAEKSSEFENTKPSSPMEYNQSNNNNNNNNTNYVDDFNHASHELTTSWEDEEEYFPSPPKRRTSRNNFASVLQRLSSVTKPTVPSKKSVRFQDDDSKNLLPLIREIESHKDYSTRERNRCWWSPSEKEKCMSKHERVVSRMEHQKPCRKNETYRGLESWTSQGAAKLDQVINICVDAVMDEQDYQWKVQKDDFDRIAAISRRVTADSANRAKLVGMRDEREALLVRDQSWTEDDDATILSAMGASVMTAVKRKKKLSLLQDKRDLSAKKPSKRTSKSPSRDKQKHASSSSSMTVLESHITKKSETTTSCAKGADSAKNSSKKSRGDRSNKSTKKESASSSSSSTSRSRKSKHEETGRRDYRRSSSHSSLSSTSKRKSCKTPSSKPDLTKCSSTTQIADRDNDKSNSLTTIGTPPTSFSSSSSTLDETSSLAAVIRQRKTKTIDKEAGNTGGDNKVSRSKRNTAEPLSVAGAEVKSSDPPGRRAARSKSSHAEDEILRTMQSQARLPAFVNVKD